MKDYKAMTREELIDIAVSWMERDMQVSLFMTKEEIRRETENTPTEYILEYLMDNADEMEEEEA